ncbi:MAG: hypothetical protein EXR06_00475 [Rickettsiales bacterium]|nr:hypothetical protein [Rickettsiales bacterium]
MKKIVVFIFSLVLFFAHNIQAEIVNLQKDEKKFGEWKVFCETDAMMSITYCRIGIKFFDNASAITIEPNNLSFNQFFITVPKIRLGNFLQIRVDQNDLLLSPIAKEKDFGLIEISDEQKIALFSQMKNGDFLFFRFNIKDSDKEITAKINLNDFRNALSYYKERVSK